MTTDHPLLRRKELAARLGLSISTIKRYDRAFARSHIRVGRSIFYDFPVVLELLRQRGSFLPPPPGGSASSKRKKHTRKVPLTPEP